MIKKNIITIAYLTITVFILVLVSCKKFPDPPLYFEDYGSDSSSLKARKVLVIGIDGFSGVDFNNSTHPGMDSLYAHSKYTMNLLTETHNNDVASWESMLTGMSSLSHLVSDSSFNPTGEMDDPDASVSIYNSLFFYLTKYSPTVQSLTISSWQTLSNNLFKGSTKRIVVDQDKTVVDSALSLLPKTSAAVSILQLNSTAIAGQQSGFGTTNSNFSAAITSIDGYISKIFSAIKSRESYSKEEWLILVVGNRGPLEKNPNNGFMLAYNQHLTKEELKLNGQSAPSVSYNGTVNNYYSIPDDGGLYNFGTNQDFTIQFSVNVASNTAYAYPVLLSKKKYTNAGATGKGWAFYLGYDKGWNIDFGAKRTSGYRLAGTPFTNTFSLRDGTWYTITAVVSNANGHRYIRGYTYCAAKDSFDVGASAQIGDALGDISTDAPLTVGHITGMSSGEGGACYFSIRNIALFNKALDSATLRNTKCLADYLKHPNVANLIGYWPNAEGAGSILNNKIMSANNGQANFVQSSGFNSWTVLDKLSLPCFLPNTAVSTSLYSIVPASEDVTTNVMSWLRMDINSTWGLNGSPWIKNFETEYVIH